MAQGLPTSLARPIVHSIDFVEAVTAVRMEVTSDVPTQARFGFRGGIGVARGQAPFMVTLTFAGTAVSIHAPLRKGERRRYLHVLAAQGDIHRLARTPQHERAAVCWLGATCP